MKQILIGHCSLGHESVDLYGIVGQQGGEFYLCPEDGSPGRIKIGLGYKEWWKVVNVLLHEALEYALEREKCRFERVTKMSGGHNDYTFILHHDDLTNACCRVADFITPVLPVLAKAWKEHKP